MKKFFIKDLANMVEKEIATEFLLRNVKLSRMAGAGRTLRSVIRVVLYTENAGPNTSRMKRITMLEKLSVLSEKLSFSGSSVRCGLSGSVRLKHTIRQISGLLCPATM